MAEINLSQVLQYEFNDKALLSSALSHRSAEGKNNERLEFLGDSIINFIIAEALFLRYPKAKEGELSRLRANLVRGETLAEIAHNFSLGHYLRLGSGELKSGGRYRQSILADALEAVIAAIYLDGGLEAVKNCILTWFDAKLQNISLKKVYKDAKSSLQELLQSRKLALPQYKVSKVEGEAHCQIFYVQCQLIDLPFCAIGQGSSRRRAEQDAAIKVLALLNEDSSDKS